jgi:hypothetical protein
MFSCPVDVFDGKDDAEHDLQGMNYKYGSI